MNRQLSLSPLGEQADAPPKEVRKKKKVEDCNLSQHMDPTAKHLFSSLPLSIELHPRLCKNVCSIAPGSWTFLLSSRRISETRPNSIQAVQGCDATASKKIDASFISAPPNLVGSMHRQQHSSHFGQTPGMHPAALSPPVTFPSLGADQLDELD